MRQTGWQKADRLAEGKQAGRRQTGWQTQTDWQKADRLAEGKQAGRRQTGWQKQTG